MKKASWFLLLLLPLISMAQQEGIQFEKGLDWEQLKQKAKIENKFIFMDCYATWCGPCKAMDQQVFPVKQVGEYFNSHFINVRVQMDQTAMDAPEIKAWYSSAKQLEKDYQINAYPTYLFFNPEGDMMHRFSGSKEAEDFLTDSKDALVPEKQSVVVMNHWKEHLSDSNYLYHALTIAADHSDKGTIRDIQDAYLGSLKNLFTRRAIGILSSRISSSKDDAFNLFVNNEDKIETIMGQKHGDLNRLIAPIIYKEEVKLALKQSDWRDVKAGLQQKYPMLRLWKTGNTDSAFLYYMLLPAEKSKDTSNLSLLARAYLSHVKNLNSDIAIRTIIRLENYDGSTKDKYFQFAVQNAPYIDSLVKNKAYPAELKGDNYAEAMLGKIIFKAEVEPIFTESFLPYNVESIITSVSNRYPTLDKNALKEALSNNVSRHINWELDAVTKMKEPDEKDWAAMLKKLGSEYIGFDCEKTLIYYQMSYYYKKKSYDTAARYTLVLIKYSKNMSDESMDTYCGTNIFENARDKNTIEEACRLMKAVVERNPDNEVYMDDYANLLYKAGHKEEAMTWETKALAISKEKSKGTPDYDINENLEKMKANLPTWTR